VPPKTKSSSFTHGYSGYTNYRCRCNICRQANTDRQYESREYWRASRDQIRATGFEHEVTNISHGISGYTNYSCRCKVCVEANRARARSAA
jgi:hypothetical protein